MIGGQKHSALILNILGDGKPHFSREFVNAGLLEYRRRITEIRREGFDVRSVKINDSLFGKPRPGYVLKKDQA